MSFQKKNSSNLTGLVWDTNMTAILFSRDTEMADVTLIILEFKVSIENRKIAFWLCVNLLYLPYQNGADCTTSALDVR